MARILPFLLISLLFACGDADTSDATSGDTIVQNGKDQPDVPANQDLTGCYLRVLQRDTLIADLVQQGELVTGSLRFDNYQKDGSSGTVSGRIDGDILRLVYRFQSEGMNSISEVFFRVTTDGLIHGIGDVGVKADSAYYSDPANIKYQDADLLKRVPCGQLR